MVLGPVGRGRRGSPERVPDQACAEGCPPRRCSSGTYPRLFPCWFALEVPCSRGGLRPAADWGLWPEPEAAQLRHADVPIAPLPLFNPHGTISRTIARLCVCSLSPFSLSLSLSSCNSSAWAILHPLSGPASTCSLSPLATASMCFLPRLPTPSVCSLRFVHVLARALLHTRSARSAGCAHLASLCSSPTSTLHLSPSQTSPQPLPITAHHHHRPPPDVPAPGDVPLPL